MAATAGTVQVDWDRSEASAKGKNSELAKRSNVYQATTSGAQTVDRYVDTIELVHATQIVATIPAGSYHSGLLYIKQTGSGTAGHTVTLTVGTFDGTNNIATFNAAGEAILVMLDSKGNGTMVINTGSVAMSATA